MEAAQFDKSYALEQLRRSRHPLRRLVKGLYLSNILNEVTGPTIDFGCGAGQLLARLPAGSVGLEINPHLVAELSRTGLNVLPYNPEADEFSLRGFQKNQYETMVVSHVIEHFSDCAQTMRRLWRTCGKLGLRKIVVIVPGAKGYGSDNTHKTFVNRRYLEEQGLLNFEGYGVTKTRYFPVNMEWPGQFFIYHEFKIVYERLA
jgi:hypothetical protein